MAQGNGNETRSERGAVQDELDDRLRLVVCAIVESYIETVEPVGSRTLSRILDVDLSPATIRNVMADLTEQGYLIQPHTSAGRVPTNQAYRYFVDTFLENPPLLGEIKRVIERSLIESGSGLEGLLATTSKLLAGLTRFTGIVSSPRISQTRLRVIEFLKINDNQIYVVLITQSNMMHQKIIETSENLSQHFLDSVSDYLNAQFASASLEDVRGRVLEQLASEQETYEQNLGQAVRLSRKAFDLANERDLYVDGQSFIVREFDNLEKIRVLLEALENKLALIDLLDATLADLAGVSVAIGLDTPELTLEDCSIVTARYLMEDRALGTIGVIGPTRMNYGRVLPIIEYTAQTLSEAISAQ